MNYSKGRLRLRFGGLFSGGLIYLFIYLFIYFLWGGGGGEGRGRIIGMLYTVETPLKDTSHKRTLPIKDTNLRSRQFLYYKSTTSFPGLFPFELGRREKTLASAGHVPNLHPKILGVFN